MKVDSRSPNLSFGIFLTIGAYLCFAIAASIVRILDVRIPTTQILFMQSIISVIFIAPIFIKKRLFRVKKELIKLHLIRSLSGVGNFFCYFLAIKQLNLVDATVLTYTAPFYTPIIWMFLSKEKKIEKGIWWTIILGFIGITLILKPTQTLLKAGSMIGITAGILGSIALVSIRLLNQKMESLIRTLFYYFFISTLLTAPFAILNWFHPTNNEWMLLISIGVLTAFAQLLLTTAYMHGTASFLSPISYSMIIFTGLISSMFFKQIPGYLSLIGTVLIIIGGSISYIIKVKPVKFIEIFEHPPEEKIHFWRKVRLRHHHIEVHKHQNKMKKD